MAKHRQQHTVREVPADMDLIDYCRRAFPLLGSKTAVKKAVAGQRLLLNGRPLRFSDQLKKGNMLELKGAGLPKARKFDQEMPIVYEDDHLIVVNKPAGIAVNGDRIKTVENALAGTVAPPSLEDALPRPVAVHRIDLPTKGLVLLAKTKQALMSLSEAFEQNEVHKAYQAVVHRKPPVRFTVDTPIDGKPALTEVKTLRTVPSLVFGQLSLVRMKPVTGRTHQLRIHLQTQGYLIVGDKTYAGEQKTILGKGLFLCACELSFSHPVTGKPVQLKIDPPRRFVKTLDREEQRSEK